MTVSASPRDPRAPGAEVENRFGRIHPPNMGGRLGAYEVANRLNLLSLGACPKNGRIFPYMRMCAGARGRTCVKS
jgi:hypothetical protein